jgi:LysR family hydrogen peroxide-inducible transcriptional activator
MVFRKRSPDRVLLGAMLSVLREHGLRSKPSDAHEVPRVWHSLACDSDPDSSTNCRALRFLLSGYPPAFLAYSDSGSIGPTTAFLSVRLVLPMELHQLRYFVAVAEAGNFGRAALRCRVSQPSLSQQIIKLEARLGRKLFDRLGRRIALTDAGLALLPRAKAILADVVEAEREIVGDLDNGRGRLAIGAIPTIAPYLLPGVIRTFLAINPEADLTVSEDLTEGLIEALADAELDLALMSLPIDDSRIIYEELMVEPLLLVAPADDPIARSRSVELRDLEDRPAVVLHELHCLSSQVQSFCQAHHLNLRIVCRTTQLTTVQSLVGLGLGISIIPEMAAIADESDRRVYRPIARGEARRSIVVAWHPGRHRPKLAERFLDQLRLDCRDRMAAGKPDPIETSSKMKSRIRGIKS